MSSEAGQSYQFGPFRLDLSEHTLGRDGQPVPLTPKVFDVLGVLVRHSGHLVTKETLLREVLPGSFVEEGALNRTVSVLRKALGDSPIRGLGEPTMNASRRLFLRRVRLRRIDRSRSSSRDLAAPLGETMTEAKILMVSVEGGDVATVASLPFEEIGSVAMTPDGRRFVVTVYSSRSDVWVADNFDVTPEPNREKAVGAPRSTLDRAVARIVNGVRPPS